MLVLLALTSLSLEDIAYIINQIKLILVLSCLTNSKMIYAYVH